MNDNVPTWILPDHERLASPNCYPGRRDPGGVEHEVDTLILHYAVDGDQTPDGSDEDLDLNFEPRLSTDDCMDVARGFFREYVTVKGEKRRNTRSAHFAVGRDGSKVQCVPLTKAAWHAGDGTLPREGIGPLGSSLPRRRGALNCRSIGIEICNVGWAVEAFKLDRQHIEAGLHHRNPACRSTKWEGYRAAQIHTLRYLVARLRHHVPTLRYVTGHEDVTHAGVTGKGAKTDPGPAFPWEAIEWGAHGFQRIVYDFRLKAWVFAGDEVTAPIDVGGHRR